MSRQYNCCSIDGDGNFIIRDRSLSSDIGESDVEIEVFATSLTDADTSAMLNRNPFLAHPRDCDGGEQVLGTCISGVVRFVGSSVDLSAVGIDDHVVCYLRGGQGLNSRVRVPWTTVFHKPESGVSHELACSHFTPGIIAYTTIFSKLHLGPGDSLTIMNAFGASSALCAQLAAHRGVHVECIVTKSEHVKQLREVVGGDSTRVRLLDSAGDGWEKEVLAESHTTSGLSHVIQSVDVGGGDTASSVTSAESINLSMSGVLAPMAQVVRLCKSHGDIVAILEPGINSRGSVAEDELQRIAKERALLACLGVSEHWVSPDVAATPRVNRNAIDRMRYAVADLWRLIGTGALGLDVQEFSIRSAGDALAAAQDPGITTIAVKHDM